MAESKEELKSLLMKVKQDSEKVDLNLNIVFKCSYNIQMRAVIFLNIKE